MLGDFSLKPFATLGRLLARTVDGRLDLCPETGQSLLEAKKRQPVEIGTILAMELPQQFISPLEVRVGGVGVLLAVQVGDGIRCSTSQASSYRRGDGLVAVILLHPGSGGFERRILPLPVDNLADNGEGKGVSIRSTLNETEDGFCGIAKVSDQPVTQAGPKFRRGIQVAARSGFRGRPEH